MEKIFDRYFGAFSWSKIAATRRRKNRLVFSQLFHISDARPPLSWQSFHGERHCFDAKRRQGKKWALLTRRNRDFFTSQANVLS